MLTYDFTFVVDRPTNEDYEDVFFEAGCDDASLLIRYGRLLVCFDREAESYKEAVLSAYEDIKKTGHKMVRFEPDYLVTVPEIARRARATRQSINLYVQGKRQQDFPAPLVGVTTDTPLWDWVEVSKWLYDRDKLDVSEVRHAVVSRVVNLRTQDESICEDLTVRQFVEKELLQIT